MAVIFGSRTSIGVRFSLTQYVYCKADDVVTGLGWGNIFAPLWVSFDSRRNYT